MFKEILPIEKETKASTIEEATEIIHHKFNYDVYNMELSEINIDQDGTFSSNQTGEIQISDWAFESVCKLLKLPVEHARKIPSDLLVHNIDRLKYYNQKRVSLFLRDGLLINMVECPYTTIFNQDLLKNLKTLNSINEMQTRSINISDRGVKIDMFHENKILEPQKGDITCVGITILNSETGFRSAVANSFLQRLVCSNGAVLNKTFGIVEWNYDYRISYNRSVQNFISKVDTFTTEQFTLLEKAYNKMTEREILSLDLLNIWRRIRRSFAKNKDAQSDMVINISKDQRNSFDAEIREGRQTQTGKTFYEVYNNVTHAAHSLQLPMHQARHLEVVGGDIVHMNMN